MTKKSTKSSTKSRSHTKKPGSKATNPFEPTLAHFELVEKLAQDGLAKRFCRHYITDGNKKSISEETFDKYFGEIHELGKGRALKAVGAAVFSAATDPEAKDRTAAAQLFLRYQQQLNPEQSIDMKLSGKKDGEPIRTENIAAAERTVGEIIAKLTVAKKTGSSEEVGLDSELEGEATSS